MERHRPRPPHPLGQLTGHTDSVGSVAFSPDGHTLATGSDDNTVLLWDVTDPAHPIRSANPDRPHRPVFSVAFTPDGHTLATGSRPAGGAVGRHRPRPPHPLGQPLTGHTNSVDSVAFTPDGHTLATGSDDRRCACGTSPTPPTPLRSANP